MPIVLERQTDLQSRLAVCHISEPLQWWLEQLPFVAGEGSPTHELAESQQLERLASRWLLLYLLGNEAYARLQKTPAGNLILEESHLCVSVSHSFPWAAAWLSDRPGGVDIQVSTDTMQRIAPRILRPEELQNAQENTSYLLLHLHVFWGAKEALYKAHSLRGLDFRKNIRVEPFDFSIAGGRIKAALTLDTGEHWFDLCYEIVENAVLVYCV